MPGEHTFYDGSRVLEPLAQLVGIEVDKVGHGNPHSILGLKSL
jgi:hypothetical protein